MKNVFFGVFVYGMQCANVMELNKGVGNGLVLNKSNLDENRDGKVGDVENKEDGKWNDEKYDNKDIKNSKVKDIENDEIGGKVKNGKIDKEDKFNGKSGKGKNKEGENDGKKKSLENGEKDLEKNEINKKKKKPSKLKSNLTDDINDNNEKNDNDTSPDELNRSIDDGNKDIDGKEKEDMENKLNEEKVKNLDKNTDIVEDNAKLSDNELDQNSEKKGFFRKFLDSMMFWKKNKQ